MTSEKLRPLMRQLSAIEREAKKLSLQAAPGVLFRAEIRPRQ